VVVFLANLGAGKTTLTQGLIRRLGIEADALSPTFVLAQTFHGKIPVHHLDFYRLNVEEILGLGIQDYLLGQGEIEKGLVLIEWAERCKDIWPKERLEIRIQTLKMKNVRKIKVTGYGKHFQQVIKKLKVIYGA
jgi:tRNA threonylcarbamoyladenosine biosynthesis protein TsaE